MSSAPNLGSEATAAGSLVYINGVRVPHTSVTVSVSSGGLSSGQVVLPAHPILRKLGDEDNLNVAVFYLDTVYYSQPTWCLLFEGRVTGQSYSKDSQNSAVSLSIESIANMLSDLYFSFLRKKKGPSTALKDYPNQIVVRGKTASSILSESLSGRPLARPFDLIENVFNICLGAKRDTARSDLRQSAPSLEARIKTLTSRLDSAYKRRLERAKRRNQRLNGDATDEELARAALLKDMDPQVISIAKAQGGSMDDTSKFQELLIRAQIAKEVQEQATRGSQVAVTGFFSRYMRLTRFREHWVCSPYLEGIPNSSDPIKAHMGGGVFPLLRSLKAKKFTKAMTRQTGAQYGPGGSALGLLTNLFNMYFYKMTEVLAPPAYQVDKFGLPNDRFYSGAGDLSDLDYVQWSATLHGAKRRLSIGSYITCPMADFSIPPSCNVLFPSTTISVNVSDSYKSKPTRVYYNKRSPYGKLSLKSNAPGYNMDPTRVGFPSVAAGHAQTAAGSSREGLEYLIFPEEYFRGPRPVMENMHPTYMDLQKFANTARFSAPKNRPAPTSLPSGVDPETLTRAVASAERLSAKGFSSYGLYFLVAQKEYLKRKYGATSAQVTSVFNPYLVVGMPCAILSKEDAGMQIMGKIESISHFISHQGSASTSLSVSNVRTVEECIQNIELDGLGLDAAPQEPVTEIRDLLQIYETANDYYTQLFKKDEIGKEVVTSSNRETVLQVSKLTETLNDLKAKKRALEAAAEDTDTIATEIAEVTRSLSEQLFKLQSSEGNEGNTINSKMPSAFDFRAFLGWKNNTGKPDFIVLDEGDRLSEDAVNSLLDAGLDATDDFDRYQSTGFQEGRRLVSLPEASRFFDSTSNALKYGSRPVCTLEQYIDFYSTAGRTAANLDPVGRGRGMRLNPKQDRVTGAVYYDVIRQFIGGPGLEPGSSVSGRSRATAAELNRAAAISTTIDPEEIDALIETLNSTPILELTTITEEGPGQVFKRFSANEVASYLDLADSRKDWQSLLLDYLTIIEGRNPIRSN